MNSKWRRKIDSKLFLWALFLSQLLLVGLFILFSSTLSLPDESLALSSSIRFIRENQSNVDGVAVTTTTTFPPLGRLLLSENVSSFNETYIRFAYNSDYFVSDTLCFREGTRNDSEPSTVCPCLPNWHGIDCGQPEVVWRAFMTAKTPAKTIVQLKRPHTVFYIIQSTAAALEMIEIQIGEMASVIDLFVLCDRMDAGIDEQLRPHLSTGFFKLYQRKVVLLNDRFCTGKSIFKRLKRLLGAEQLRPDDVLLYSRSHEVTNRRAINFFKWHDGWPQPVSFRLKYNVYGFFWQHPESTIIGSGAVTVRMLAETYKSDPERMLATRKPGLIVGDLNHAGGWFCQYCAQPTDIVHQLTIEADAVRNGSEANVAFSAASKQKTIDAEYVTTLIANGLYIDGKLGLIKLRQYLEKYFAPAFVLANEAKFDNLVTNIFAKWEADYEE